MLNILWPIFIISSFIYAILSGNIDKINNSIFSSTADAIQLVISLLGTMCLWMGIMRIMQETSLMGKLVNGIKPLINFLFPEIKNNDKVKKQISLNIVANLLGLGNAATPLGLKAMKTLQEENSKKDTVSNSMAMFILLNTASLQIIPTTVIGIRSSLGSALPTKIVFPVWIATLSAAIAGIISIKVFIKLSDKRGK